MKTKLKIIIPIAVAAVTVIIAAVFINFSPKESVDVSSLMSTAQKYLVEQNYEQAIAEFGKVIDLDPMNADAYLGLAEAYIAVGDTESAIEILQKGYELTGDERLKKMLDELIPPEPEETTVITTAATTVPTTVTTTETTTVSTVEMITVPDLSGLTMEEAVSMCEEAGLLYSIRTVENRAVEKDHVISQSVAAGESLPADQSVVIIISDGMPVVTTTVPETTTITTTVTTTAAPSEPSEATLLNSVKLSPRSTDFEPLDELVESTLNKITKDDMTTYEKVKACYDFLINECSYGSNEALYDYIEYYFFGYANEVCAYGMLKGHVGVCDDYAAAFAALTTAIGLDCSIVTGTTSKAGGGYTAHAWCVITIDGTEYVFDPQVEDNIAKGGAIQYLRFCKKYEEVPGKYNPA